MSKPEEGPNAAMQATERIARSIHDSIEAALRTMLDVREAQPFAGLWVSEPLITLEDGPRRTLRHEHRHVSFGADTEEAFWDVARHLSREHGPGMVYVVRDRGEWAVADLPRLVREWKDG